VKSSFSTSGIAEDIILHLGKLPSFHDILNTNTYESQSYNIASLFDQPDWTKIEKKIEKFQIPGLPSIGELKDKIRNTTKDNIEKNIDNFQLPGFPSIGDIRESIEETTNGIFEEKIGNFQLPGLPSIKEIRSRIKNSSLPLIGNIQTELEESAKEKIDLLTSEVTSFSKSQLSTMNSLFSILNLDPSEASVNLSDVLYVLENPTLIFEKLLDNVNTILDLKTGDSYTKDSSQKLEEFLENLKLPDAIKLQDSLNKSIFTSLNISWIDSDDTWIELLDFLKNNKVVEEIRKHSSGFPDFEETVGTLFDLKSIFGPDSILEQIEEDINKFSRVLINIKSRGKDDILNTTLDDLYSLHLYQHLKNASETLREVRLPGLPSVGDIIERSSLDDIANFQIAGLPPVKDILNTDNIKSVRKTLDTLSLEKESSRDTPIQDAVKKSSRSDLHSSEELEDYELTSYQTEPAATTEEYSLLPNISGLFNPAVDVDNLMAVTKIIPHLIPFMVRDYKEKIAGWLSGTEVGQQELAGIHSTLVNWHNKIVYMRESIKLNDEVKQVLLNVEENNLGLLNLVLHMLYRASTSTKGTVVITMRDLETLDKYLLRPEQVFPPLTDFFG